MCDCIDKLSVALKEKFGPGAHFDLKLHCNMRTGVCSAVPSLNFTYLEKKKDGTWKSKPTKGHMLFSHCPFCGVKLDKLDTAQCDGEAIARNE